MRDILARWAGGEHAAPGGEPAPVVYRDNVMARLMDAFESLSVSASESMQHQTYAELLLRRSRRYESAAAVDEALVRLAESVGRLGSRATRAGA